MARVAAESAREDRRENEAMTLHMLREAEHETELAVLWYEEQKQGLGEELVTELERIYGRIEENPRIFSRVSVPTEESRDVRRAIVSRFPYKVIFEVVDSETIVVVAVAHQRRKPNYWIERLSN